MGRARKLFARILSLIENDHETSVPDASRWKQIGSAKGSNPGGQFKDEKGNHYYVKHSKSDEHARSEVLYSHMLRHMNVPVLKHELVKHNGRLAVASPMENERQTLYRPFNSFPAGRLKHDRQ